MEAIRDRDAGQTVSLTHYSNQEWMSKWEAMLCCTRASYTKGSSQQVALLPSVVTWRLGTRDPHRINLSLGGKVGGNALCSFAHGPAGFIVASQLFIQGTPIPTTEYTH